MFCQHCGKELEENSVFCIGCGTKQIDTPPAHEKTTEPLPAAAEGMAQNRQKSKGLLWGAAGFVIGAIVLGVILFASGVLSSGGRIEGPGFGAPEDAAKAYLAGLGDQNIDDMVSTFAVETYAEHYNFEAYLKRLNAYTPVMEMRFPDTRGYTLQMNIESRRSRIVDHILDQYMQYQVPDIFGNGEIISFVDRDVSEFVQDFEKDTKDYVFKDLSVVAALSMHDLPDEPTWDDIEDLIPRDVLKDLPIDLMKGQLESLAQTYKMERNQDHISQTAKIYGADIDDVDNVVVIFKADNRTWVFCPEVIRFNGKWYIETLQGNLASLAGLSVFTGGIVPVD